MESKRKETLCPCFRGYLRVFVPWWFLSIALVSAASFVGSNRVSAAPIVPPASADARLVIDLVAAEPDIVTPTGIATDARGRVWVIENNTHMTPKGYKGHSSDRVLVMEDFGADGRARRISQFADGLKDSMSIAVRPGGEVYVVCRNRIVLFHERDGRPKGPPRQIVTLDSKATYPHNGLDGITFSPDGQWMYFALGLNTGYSYRVIGSDGSTLAGGGEGGSMYRCRPDGSRVERIATGFWNVHDLTFDAAGHLFAVDNDPDDRPPCRLLDIIEGGDYGWKFINGRKGTSPFTSWAGEFPGTLPMISAVGEAPSGIVDYESNGLPGEYRGQLLVTSWGDHVIQHFTLQPKGASFMSHPEILVAGGADFRPVGIAVAPDGSLFVSDWADKSYPVHGKGRVWRVRMKEATKGGESLRPERPAETEAFVQRATLLALPADSGLASADDISTKLKNPAWQNDPYLLSAGITALARSSRFQERLETGPAGGKWGLVEALAARRSGHRKAVDIIPGLLRSPDPEPRRMALQWVAEDRLTQFADQVPQALKAGPVTREVLEATLACRDRLASPPPEEGRAPPDRPGGQLALGILFDGSFELPVRRLALELADPRDKSLSAQKLTSLLDPIGVEAVRALAWRGDDPSQAALREIAGDENRNAEWRHEAIAGLAASAGSSSETRRLLLDILHDGPPELRSEALRSLRGLLDKSEAERLMPDLRAALAKPDLGTPDDRREWLEQMLLAFKATPDALTDAERQELQKLAGPRPQSEQAWQAALADKGDPDAGRRAFFLASGARCYVCHMVNNRGGNVGPDLSHVGAAMDRRKIVESILDPSREIAPMYVPMVFTLKNGDVVTGIAGLEDVGADFVQVRDATGKALKIRQDDIVARRQEKISVMPANLPEGMTVREFRDVVEFLAGQK
jgi:putative membrane-bound dehydrogenase-like protein